MKRKWAVGDIRGDLKLFKSLLDKLGPNEGDTVVFLGSYLGPGPDSAGCVSYALELRKKMPNTFLFLRGCYEFMFGRCIGNKPAQADLDLWGKMQGHHVMRSYADPTKLALPGGGSYEVPMRIPLDHLRFFEELHQWYEDSEQPFVASHAGYHPGFYIKPVEEMTVFTPRDWWLKSDTRLPGYTIIFSHVPFSAGPFRKFGKIGIDLGAGLSPSGKLCAYEMTGDKFTIVG